MADQKIRNLVLIGVMTAVLCVLAPMSVPIGPIPISLATFVIYLTVYILGAKRGALCILVYLLIGLAGLPVFSGYAGGPAKLFGPTGGYLIGYLPMALIAGIFIEKFDRKLVQSIAGMVLATAVLYLIGTAWLAYSAHMNAQAAISAGVLPFIPLDLVKIVVSAIVGPVLYKALTRAGLLGTQQAAA